MCCWCCYNHLSPPRHALVLLRWWWRRSGHRPSLDPREGSLEEAACRGSGSVSSGERSREFCLLAPGLPFSALFMHACVQRARSLLEKQTSPNIPVASVLFVRGPRNGILTCASNYCMLRTWPIAFCTPFRCARGNQSCAQTVFSAVFTIYGIYVGVVHHG